MNRVVCCAGLVGLLCVFPRLVDAQYFFDDFDSYPTGITISGLGGWQCWGLDPVNNAQVVDFFSHSPPNSVAIFGNADIVQVFNGLWSGRWRAEVWVYVPSTQHGDVYFNILNRYDDYCLTADACIFSVQVRLNADDGWVDSEGGNNNPSTAPPLPLLTDQWGEIVAEIDLDLNTYTLFYNGTWLDTLPWVVTGDLAIAAIDLFSSDSTESYMDDVLLDRTDLIFADGFESGGTGEWTSTSP